MVGLGAAGGASPPPSGDGRRGSGPPPASPDRGPRKCFSREPKKDRTARGVAKPLRPLRSVALPRGVALAARGVALSTVASSVAAGVSAGVWDMAIGDLPELRSFPSGRCFSTAVCALSTFCVSRGADP